MLEYLSPSGINLFLENKEQFYIKYMSGRPRVEEEQTLPMAVGSAFDAFVKSHLHQLFLGKNHPDAGKFELETLFKAQVQKHLWDQAYQAGESCFKFYKDSGALASLLLEMNGTVGEPRFEAKVVGVVSRNMKSVTLLGFPDLVFISNQGVPAVIDWKVNGYCAYKAPSPKPGYVREYPSGRIHRDSVLGSYKGLTYSKNYPLNEVEFSWAVQLCVYGWITGQEVGETIMVGIDQLLGKCERVASHRSLLTHEFQLRLWDTITDIWERCESGHFFTEMSREESVHKCEALKVANKDFLSW